MAPNEFVDAPFPEQVEALVRFWLLIRRLLTRHIDLTRVTLLALSTVALAVTATFRNFGFDLDSAKQSYPFVAEGWGLWFWIAQIGLPVSAFFLLVNLLFSAQILAIAFPHKLQASARAMSVGLLLFLVFWYLFGQTRYGMAVALLALAARSDKIRNVIFAGIAATLIHKAAAGGVALILVWMFLRKWRFGLLVAAVSSGVCIYLVQSYAKTILIVTGYYEAYAGWESMPIGNTPYKYYILVALLVIWRFSSKKEASELLILPLLFLPFAYIFAFAGRSYMLFAPVCGVCLQKSALPGYAKNIVLCIYMADVVVVLFTSGSFF
jgi:hypothetical protein